ncbi:AimR family lysis-lysogeny pheromone receptor [Bacillus sp. BB56-3]|uniref:AimR family lysis-lysogeny pheromone receptor n=1 Tax=Bacillus sp. BB56-3 TaxID=2217831 RepID=UPI0011EE0914|nr:AimR family lysis-lysogeny pheromone receptor [Bacillus sp. BB56-3]KAA0784329.1 XRE family transcriptional regulator [Bacillus sp. BB56-3]
MNTLPLLQEINVDKKKKKITNEQLADWLGVSKGFISQIFSGTSRITFMDFVNMVRYIYQDEERERRLIFEFCTGTTKPLNLCVAMEFASVEREYDLLNFLVQKGLNHHNAMVKECATFYDYIYKRFKGKLKGNRLWSAIMNEKKKPSYVEMKSLHALIIMYSFIDAAEYNSLLKFSPMDHMDVNAEEAKNEEEAKNKEKKINDEYIKRSYEIRVKELQVIAHLMNNNVNESRKIALEAISTKNANDFPAFTASIYHYLGQSYLHEDVKKSIEWVEKAKILLESYKTDKFEKSIQTFNETLDFIKIEAEIDLHTIVPRSLGEMAHLFIKLNRKEEATKILNQRLEEDKDGAGKPYYYYYLGLATGEKSYFEKSRVLFEQHGNRFYAELPNRFLKG